MKTKGRPKSTNIDDRRFEKARPKPPAPYSTKKAKKERVKASFNRYKRGTQTEFVTDPSDKNKVMMRVSRSARGKKATVTKRYN